MKRYNKNTAASLLIVLLSLSAFVTGGCSGGEGAETMVITMPEPGAEDASDPGSSGDDESMADEENGRSRGTEERAGDEDTHIVEIVLTPSPTPEPTIAPTPTPVPTPKLPEVTEIHSTKGYVRKDGVNLREDPSTDSEVLDVFDKAVKLSITGEAEDWYRVKVDGTTGFMSKELVGKGSVPAALTIDDVERHNGAVTASGVNMRSEPTTKADRVLTLDVFDHFTITGENDEWYRVEFDGKLGYVSRKYAEPAYSYYEGEDLLLVAQIVHQEAKNTSLEGKIAVANVVYNRVRSSKFPNTIEGVIFEEGQFSPADNESSLRKTKPNGNAIKAVAEIFIRNKTILPSSVMYFRSAKQGTSWGSRSYYDTFGGNCFYK